MREIKFRSWDIIKKKMFSAEEMGRDQLTLSPDGRGFINVSSTHVKLSNYATHLLPLEYTGLKDKNDKEIYEGDKDNKGGVIKWSNKCSAFKIIYSGNSFYLGPYLKTRNIEIIGNIYENPELLEKEVKDE